MTTFPYTIDYAELKDMYINAVDGKRLCKRQANNSNINRLIESWQVESDFYGPSSAQVIEWLHKGYRQPGLTLEPPVEPIRKRRRLTFAEEGELQLDLVYSGHDYPFLDWTKRDVLPGMKVSILTVMSSTTRKEIIHEYNRWILRALVALESAGIDLEVWISDKSSGVWDNPRGETLDLRIRVKTEGRQTDLLSWSPMLSPAGFRHLSFLGLIVASDGLQRTASHGLGRGVQPHKWSVEYDLDDRELIFNCPYTPSEFPEGAMDTALRDVMLQARRQIT